MAQMGMLSAEKLLASLLIGVDKGGIPGLGALGMALALNDSRNDTNIGHILAVFAPVLMVADIGAIAVYWKDVQLKIVIKMLISIIIGMVIGFVFLGKESDRVIRQGTGWGLLLLSAVYYGSKGLSSMLTKSNLLPHFQVNKHDDVGGTVSSTAIQDLLKELVCWSVGLTAGGLTVVANVAGPIIAIYFIQLQLSKRCLNGTRAVVFLFINFVKIPAQIFLGNFVMGDLLSVVPLSCVSLLSTFLTEHFLMPHIKQHLFENVAWVLVAIGALRLVIS
jgi:uncharacterized membrane protein YfcA